MVASGMAGEWNSKVDLVECVAKGTYELYLEEDPLYELQLKQICKSARNFYLVA